MKQTLFAIAMALVAACGSKADEAAPSTPAKPVEPAVPADPTAGWKVHKSTEGGYSVKLPGEPKLEQQSQPTESGTTTVHVATYARQTDGFIVMWHQHPAGAPKDPKAILDTINDTTLSMLPGKVLAREDIKLGTHPGRAVTTKLSNQPSTMRTRTFVVGDRVYQVWAMGNGDGNPRAAEAFLDSFTVTQG
jgi:hypothetical protein